MSRRRNSKQPSAEIKKRDRFYTMGTVQRCAAPGRNSPCPCGSGAKWKNCCLDADPTSGMGPAQRLFVLEQQKIAEQDAKLARSEKNDR